MEPQINTHVSSVTGGDTGGVSRCVNFIDIKFRALVLTNNSVLGILKQGNPVFYNKIRENSLYL